MTPATMQLPKHWPQVLTSFVNGRFLPLNAAASRTQTVFASTNEPIVEYAHAQSADINAAVHAAKAAQPEWARKTPTERGRVLTKAAHLLAERTEELAHLETLNTSRAISETVRVHFYIHV